jgi:excisionase family DNA binding protein
MSVQWLTPQEVALMVGFSESFIYKEIKQGHLHAYSAHNRWRIHISEATAYHVRLYGHAPTTQSAHSAPSS